MVEDAVLTNSPCSFRVASNSLLVTPSCLASSCTRSFPGTFLLVFFSEKAHARKGSRTQLRLFARSSWTFIADASSCAHQCSVFFPISRSSLGSSRNVARYFRTGPVSTGADTRNARLIALRFSADSNAPNVGVIQQPRPGIMRFGSGMITAGDPCRATRRNK